MLRGIKPTAYGEWRHNMIEKRNFALRDKEGNEIGVFSGKQPRQAA
ncbi:MAG TPA: non-histone chromosomal MC1 family protein, partial [Methanothrix soehngenii]|nr:non-histone chromosomal MC1 family protein [Methanothrix soehngenii]HQI54407.1 non-histone chromosomal MC1 family protein [Methanothrix soehngenii]HQJ62121.1 non-histone chromosomal MC1 family protein [Methanothrix soehngenii]